MAKTTFGVNHPLAVDVFSSLLNAEAYRRTFIGKFIGKGEDALIQEMDDLKKSAGDNITFGLQVQLQGDGVEGDATLEGNEEALVHYDDNIRINQLRHAVRLKGKMTEQRVPYNLRERSKDRLGDWWARRMDESFANHVCGFTNATDTRRTGHNAVLAPSSNRHIFAGTATDEQSLTTGDEFGLEMVDRARVMAETASIEAGTGPLVRPISLGGTDYYVMFLHDYQVYDLRTSASDGDWLDIQKAAMTGGDVHKNPIFTGALGVHNGVVLHKWSRVTNGINSSTGVTETDVRRAVLCGAQAASIAFGADGGKRRYSWTEKLFDYANQFGVEAGSIWGLKKNRFIPEDDSTTNAEDFGTVVASTYAVDPNA